LPTVAPVSRRTLLAGLAGTAAMTVLPAFAQTAGLTREIPSSGEKLPMIGLGSWITFNVGNDPRGRAASIAVMREFFRAGGRMVDSSPMYGSSQGVIGEGLKTLDAKQQVFSAEKVWTSSGRSGPPQIEATRRHWGVEKFDLLQVHNLLGWEAHLETLSSMKAEGRVRYIGVTTSEGRRHDEIERIMRSQPIDFVQISYNVLDREIEQRILPLARELRIGVIVNRPFRQGDLIQAVERHPLPGWAAEIGAKNWAQLLLKFIVAEPAITCVIPATTRTQHLAENMGAGHGALPDANVRRRIVSHVEGL
jgi:diketogulonate reductase-like aldo/keto reductase